MADPLSIAASIVGVASFGLSITQQISTQLRNFSHASAEVSALEAATQDVQSLTNRMLSLANSGLELDEHDRDLLEMLFRRCSEAFTMLQEKLKKYDMTNEKGMKRALKSLNWVVKGEEVKELMEALEKAKDSLNVALQISVQRCTVQTVARVEEAIELQRNETVHHIERNVQGTIVPMLLDSQEAIVARVGDQVHDSTHLILSRLFDSRDEIIQAMRPLQDLQVQRSDTTDRKRKTRVTNSYCTSWGTFMLATDTEKRYYGGAKVGQQDGIALYFRPAPWLLSRSFAAHLSRSANGISLSLSFKRQLLYPHKAFDAIEKGDRVGLQRMLEEGEVNVGDVEVDRSNWANELGRCRGSLLHAAAKYGQNEIYEMLVAGGADKDLVLPHRVRFREGPWELNYRLGVVISRYMAPFELGNPLLLPSSSSSWDEPCTDESSFSSFLYQLFRQNATSSAAVHTSAVRAYLENIDPPVYFETYSSRSKFIQSQIAHYHTSSRKLQAVHLYPVGSTPFGLLTQYLGSRWSANPSSLNVGQYKELVNMVLPKDSLGMFGYILQILVHTVYLRQGFGDDEESETIDNWQLDIVLKYCSTIHDENATAVSMLPLSQLAMFTASTKMFDTLCALTHLQPNEDGDNFFHRIQSPAYFVFRELADSLGRVLMQNGLGSLTSPDYSRPLLKRMCHLIAMGVDINARNHFGRTPLAAVIIDQTPWHRIGHKKMEKSRAEAGYCDSPAYNMIKLLLTCGAVHEKGDQAGLVPLHIAILSGNLPSVLKLLCHAKHSHSTLLRGLAVATEARAWMLENPMPSFEFNDFKDPELYYWDVQWWHELYAHFGVLTQHRQILGSEINFTKSSYVERLAEVHWRPASPFGCSKSNIELAIDCIVKVMETVVARDDIEDIKTQLYEAGKTLTRVWWSWMPYCYVDNPLYAPEKWEFATECTYALNLFLKKLENEHTADSEKSGGDWNKIYPAWDRE